MKDTQKPDRKKLLVIVDPQNDFCCAGFALPCANAGQAVENICKLLKSERFDAVICTKDTHTEDYEYTREGRMLPIEHCIKGTPGWRINQDIYQCLYGVDWYSVQKTDFMMDPGTVKGIQEQFMDHDIFICGFATDICVLNMALVLNRTHLNGTNTVTVLKDCCAGTSVEMHEMALKIMAQNQIEIR